MLLKYNARPTFTIGVPLSDLFVIKISRIIAIQGLFLERNSKNEVMLEFCNKRARAMQDMLKVTIRAI